MDADLLLDQGLKRSDVIMSLYAMNNRKLGAMPPNKEKIMTLEAQFKKLKDLKLFTQLTNKVNQN